jgi:hypothetical protein
MFRANRQFSCGEISLHGNESDAFYGFPRFMLDFYEKRVDIGKGERRGKVLLCLLGCYT